MESTTKGLAGALKERGCVEGSSFVSAAESWGIQHEYWFLCATQHVAVSSEHALSDIISRKEKIRLLSPVESCSFLHHQQHIWG